MLKISIIESPAARTLVLEGRLTEIYIPELESAWRDARSANPARGFIVDLRNATYIDEKVECLLLRMKLGGAEFVACGISTRHKLEQLGIPCGRTSPGNR